MRKIVALCSIVFLLVSTQVWAQSSSPRKVIYPTKVDKSKPLRELAKEYKAKPLLGKPREVPNILTTPAQKKYEAEKAGELHAVDPALQTSSPLGNAVTVNLNFDGASNDDNSAVVGFKVAPPDPNMDVGPNHIVQMMNLVFTIWDKAGLELVSPTSTDALWAGFGGNCEFNNDGDPIVLYDHLADRWILTQFVFSSDQCIAVSEGPDPTGAYFRFEFSTPGNDYPKLGVMEDAIYATIRNFSGIFQMDAGAFERDKLLTGDPTAQMVMFSLSAALPGIDGFIPSDLEGPAPPAGTPGFIAGHLDGTDQVALFNIDVDWANVNNSVLNGPTFLSVNSYDGIVPNIPQPSPGLALDDLSFFTMNRLAFRDMGDHFAMVTNHTVDINDFAGHAGIRWYELRDNSRTGNSWSVFQQGTYSPDSEHRWMGSAAINANGDIALSYTVSSSSTFPSIRVTGRSAGDPLGEMTMPEETIIAGTGAQTGTSRWGDYSSLTVDPTNDLTFFGTHEYVKTTGSFNWWTRVFSFDVSTSTPTPPTITSTAGTSATVGQAYVYDVDNTVDVTGTAPITFTFTGPAGFNVDANTGVVSWTPTSADVGANPITITATNSAGSDVQSFTIDVVDVPDTPPTITSTAGTNAIVGQAYVYDADNTVDVTGTAPITFTFTGPTGFNVDVNTGVVSWTPTSTDIGSNPVTITATNSAGSDVQSFSIEVTDVPAYSARINCGGSDFTTGAGDLFVADKAYTIGDFGHDGSGGTFSFTNDITGTTDDGLFQSLRGSSSSTITYLFDVPSAGDYNVDLYFMEPTFGSGDAVMDVSAEGIVVINDLNIVSEAGGNFAALVKSFTANVTDGQLTIAIAPVTKAALISAIAVNGGTPPPPPPNEPDIDVSPLSLNFGQVVINQTADLTVNVSNVGAVDLNVSALNITNTLFSVVSPATPFIVPANGGSQIVTVRFSPTAISVENGNLEIVSDDPDEGSVNVSLAGEGVAVPAGDVFRINAAGADFTDGNGNLFVADQAYTSGGFGFEGGREFNFTDPIGGTTDDLLYQDIRAERGSFFYRFDVSASGNFDVTLFLMAPAFGSGNIVMDVLAEGSAAISGLDIDATAGGTFQALTQTFTVNVTDGTLDLEFVEVNKAAVVSAISVIQQAAPTLAKNDGQNHLTANVPDKFQLYQNFPNPFNPSTRIRYDLPQSSLVTLKVYNLLGEEVRTLVNQFHSAGSYDVEWDARDNTGARMPSGLYIYRFKGEGIVEIKKMVLLR